MWYTNIWISLQEEFYETIEWAKCGDSSLSLVPTLLWAVGVALVSYRLIMTIFRRFLFRRVPLWELMLQHLLFVWVVIYSMHGWVMLVKGLKVLVDICYDDVSKLYTIVPSLSLEESAARKVMQQWIIWFAGISPLAYFVHTRPRPQAPPLMIWITTSPWQRREMGPYGYYLNRPLSTLDLDATVIPSRHIVTPRKAFSDSKLILKEPPKKKRYSKSV